MSVNKPAQRKNAPSHTPNIMMPPEKIRELGAQLMQHSIALQRAQETSTKKHARSRVPTTFFDIEKIHQDGSITLSHDTKRVTLTPQTGADGKKFIDVPHHNGAKRFLIESDGNGGLKFFPYSQKRYELITLPNKGVFLKGKRVNLSGHGGWKYCINDGTVEFTQKINSGLHKMVRRRREKIRFDVNGSQKIDVVVGPGEKEFALVTNPATKERTLITKRDYLKRFT